MLVNLSRVKMKHSELAMLLDVIVRISLQHYQFKSTTEATYG